MPVVSPGCSSRQQCRNNRTPVQIFPSHYFRISAVHGACIFCWYNDIAAVGYACWLCLNRWSAFHCCQMKIKSQNYFSFFFLQSWMTSWLPVYVNSLTLKTNTYWIKAKVHWLWDESISILNLLWDPRFSPHNRFVFVCASALQYEELFLEAQLKWINNMQAIWSKHTKGPSCYAMAVCNVVYLFVLVCLWL